MGDLSRQEIENLILGYEDLEPSDRAVADRFLSQDPRLAARLKWHQDLEASSAASLSVDDDSFELSDEESRAQQESLRRILAAIDQSNPESEAKIISFGDKLRRSSRWMLPLAAILAFAIFFPRGAQEKFLLQDLSVSQVELMPDGTRGPEHPVAAGSELHTGQAFALDFSLNEDSFVVIYHVDPRGQVSRVYPDTITDDLVPLRGGQGHQIPSIESGEAWILGSETGTESFLVAAHPSLLTALANIAVTSSLDNRADILVDLQTQLEALATQVDLYEFQHVD